jgi:hypothetical protein
MSVSLTDVNTDQFNKSDISESNNHEEGCLQFGTIAPKSSLILNEQHKPNWRLTCAQHDSNTGLKMLEFTFL